MEHGTTANVGRRDALGLMTGISAAALAGGWVKSAMGQETSPIKFSTPADTAESMGWDDKKKEYVLPPLPYK
ncbi:MAG TPA: hypothetical protein VG711_12525, partial [Phycisphaerales bacterium]|nr:hypothetical protein [Phycisphaerales bacterium]